MPVKSRNDRVGGLMVQLGDAVNLIAELNFSFDESFVHINVIDLKTALLVVRNPQRVNKQTLSLSLIILPKISATFLTE